MRPPATVLVIVTRRIGDVLLTSPLIHSLKCAWPQVAIDVLVYSGTEGVLAANPDVRRVLAIAERPHWRAHIAFALRIARRYDVALSVVPSDRPTVYAWIAGRWRAGLALAGPKHWWKRWLLQRAIAFDDLNTHTVDMHLALAQVLDIEPRREVIASWTDEDRAALARALVPGAAYAVLHPYPKFNYKMWRPDAWIEVARWLRARGLRVVLSGGGAAAEREYVAAIARGVPGAIDLSGTLTLGAAACLTSGAQLYAGPDTALTHMAAAVGVPVVALYGPSNPVKWGPWPKDYSGTASPWRRHGTQSVRNLTLIQGQGACVPCLKEGCERNVASYSDCLQALPVQTVLAAFERALARPAQAYPL